MKRLAILTEAVVAFFSAMAQRIDALAPRDRRALQIGAVLVILIVVVGSVTTLAERARNAEVRIARKQQLFGELPARIDQLRRTARLGADASLPLGSLANRISATAGLQGSIEVSPDGAVVLQFSAVPFDNVLELLAEFEANRIVLRQARIGAASAPGLVDARFDLAPRAP